MAGKGKERGTGQVNIMRHEVKEINIFEVTEDELNQLEHGTNSDLFLEFSISLLSVFVSFTISLLTTKIESNTTFMVFFCVTLISFVLGVLLFVLWFRNKKERKTIIQTVRNRKENAD